MALQILRIWTHGVQDTREKDRVELAISEASVTLNIPTRIWGEVNTEDPGPIPKGLGFDDLHDFLDADVPAVEDIIRIRDRYLDANYRPPGKPVYVLFVVPPGKIENANGFSIRNGYCSIVPVPTGERGTADGHTFAHEIGHGLSLGHSDSPDNLMFPFRLTLSGERAGHNLERAQRESIGTFVKKYPSLLEEKVSIS